MPTQPRTAEPSEFMIVLAGGLLLAAIAGFINVVVLALGSLPVTHMTGAISRVSGDLGRGDLADAWFVAGLAFAFTLGAMLSGVIIGGPSLRLGRRYGIAILIEAALLALAALTAHDALHVAALLAAAGAGLQNAMASSYRSLIVRTTHVTGVLTDLGTELGRRLAGHRTPQWRVALLAGLLFAFIAGGISGAVAHASLGAASLWIPTAMLALMGLGYRVAPRRRPPATKPPVTPCSTDAA